MNPPTLAGVSFACAPFSAVVVQFRLGLPPLVSAKPVHICRSLPDQLELGLNAAIFAHCAPSGISPSREWQSSIASEPIAMTVSGALDRVADSIGDGRMLLASPSAHAASALIAAIGAARMAHMMARPGLYYEVVEALRCWLPPPVRPPSAPYLPPPTAGRKRPAIHHRPPTALALAFARARSLEKVS